MAGTTMIEVVADDKNRLEPKTTKTFGPPAFPDSDKGVLTIHDPIKGRVEIRNPRPETTTLP